MSDRSRRRPLVHVTDLTLTHWLFVTLASGAVAYGVAKAIDRLR
jgi:hypothetical protein